MRDKTYFRSGYPKSYTRVCHMSDITYPTRMASCLFICVLFWEHFHRIECTWHHLITKKQIFSHSKLNWTEVLHLSIENFITFFWDNWIVRRLWLRPNLHKMQPYKCKQSLQLCSFYCTEKITLICAWRWTSYLEHDIDFLLFFTLVHLFLLHYPLLCSWFFSSCSYLPFFFNHFFGMMLLLWLFFVFPNLLFHFIIYLLSQLLYSFSRLTS